MYTDRQTGREPCRSEGHVDRRWKLSENIKISQVSDGDGVKSREELEEDV